MAKLPLYIYEGIDILNWKDIQKKANKIASTRPCSHQEKRWVSSNSIAWLSSKTEEHQFLTYIFKHNILYERHVESYGHPLSYGINLKSIKLREDRSIYVLFARNKIISFRASSCKLKPTEYNRNTYAKQLLKRAFREKVGWDINKIKSMSKDPLTDKIYCPYCKQKKHSSCIELDHTDRTFAIILRKFEDYLIELGYQYYPTLLVPNFVGDDLSPNAVYPVFLDKSFQELWIDFHDSHANLTIKCRDCHQAKTLSEGDYKRRSNLQLPVYLDFYTSDCWDDHIKSHPDIAV